MHIEANPNVMTVEENLEPWATPNTNERLHYVKQVLRSDVPDAWTVIIGDAVHNMRAALDHLACDLVRLNGGSTHKVYFPFCRNGNGLEKMIKDKHINRAAPDVVDIVRTLKPYDRGNQDLWDVHELDIADKHQGLIPVVTLPQPITIDGGPWVWTQIGVRTEPEGVNMMDLKVFGTGKLQVGQQFTAPLDILFGSGPLEGKPIVTTLHQLLQVVDGIIVTFDAHLGSRDGT